MALNSQELISAIQSTISEYETGTKGFFARLGFGSSPGIGHGGAPTKIAGVNRMLNSIKQETNDETKLAMLMALIAAIDEKKGSLPGALANKLITGEYQKPANNCDRFVTQQNTLAGPIGHMVHDNADAPLTIDIHGANENEPPVIGCEIAKQSTVKAFVDDYGSKLTGELKNTFDSNKSMAALALDGKALEAVQMTTRRNFTPE